MTANNENPMQPLTQAPRRPVWRSLIGSLLLLGYDCVLHGTFLASFMVCPIWFLVSVIKNVIQRPGWRIALFRIAMPALTLGLVLANNSLQWRIAKTNADRVIKACEEFHAENDQYPNELTELVPRYLRVIPQAKYCVMFGEFQYWNGDYGAKLQWYAIPPFGREIYDFEKRRWSYLD